MPLKIGGLTPFTLIDFPGQLAAVLFCQGCCWDCAYCHNQHLLPVSTPPTICWQEVIDFLQARQGFLDGVVFSGGEPLIQAELLDAIKAIRQLGFKTALHTAGTSPQRLQRVLPYLDWVGFDIKAAFADYEKVTEVPDSGLKAEQSLKLLLDSGVAYELRTTFDPKLLNAQDLTHLKADLKRYGVVSKITQLRTI